MHFSRPLPSIVYVVESLIGWLVVGQMVVLSGRYLVCLFDLCRVLTRRYPVCTIQNNFHLQPEEALPELACT
jgi:hypothetical protein